MKKNLCKILSMALSLIILASMLTVLPAFAASSVVFTDNFASAGESEAALINAAQLTSSATSVTPGWNNMFNSGCSNTTYAEPKGGLSISNGEISFDENLLNGLGIQPFGNDSAPTTGVYQLDFQVLTSGSQFIVDAAGSIDRLKINTNSYGKTRSVLYTLAGNAVFLPPASNAVSNISASHIIGYVPDTSKWLDVTAVFDLDNKLLHIVSKQDGKVVATQGTNDVALGTDITTNGLKYIRFMQYNSYGNAPIKLKNITLKKLDSISDVGFLGWGQNFEFITNGNFNKTNFFTTATPWTSNAFNRSGFRITASADPKADVSFVNETGTKAYIKIDRNSTSAITQFNMNLVGTKESAIKGIIHVSYDIKVTGSSGSAQALALTTQDASGGIPATLEFAPGSNSVYVNGETDSAYSTTNKTHIGSYNPDKWAVVDQYIDTVNGRWYVIVKQNGYVVAKTSSNGALVRANIVTNGIRSLSYRPMNAGVSVSLDNIQAEQVSEIPAFEAASVFIDKVYKADDLEKTNASDITSFADLEDGKYLYFQTFAINDTQYDEHLIWIAAYYDAEGSLLEIKNYSLKNALQPGYIGIPLPAFQFDKPEGAAKLKVFLWQDIDNTLTPYCKALLFE